MAVVLGTHAGPAAEIVIPTVGRPSLVDLLRALAAQDPRWPGRITVVDDRADADRPLPALSGGGLDVAVVRSGARGPAAARNTGLADARAPWVVFLDDDVVPTPGWVAALHTDLAATDEATVAVRGRVVIRPEPDGDPTVPPGTLETAGTSPNADFAYRRDALTAVGGFDERLAHPHHEHAEVALRLRRTGAEVVPGRRTAWHAPRPVGARATVAHQRRLRDDARMRWEHGRHWRREAGVGRSRVRQHLVTTGSGLIAVAAAATGHRRIATVGGALWLALTTGPAWAPAAVGTRAPRARASAAFAGAAVPPTAVYHRICGELAVRKMATP